VGASVTYLSPSSTFPFISSLSFHLSIISFTSTVTKPWRYFVIPVPESFIRVRERLDSWDKPHWGEGRREEEGCDKKRFFSYDENYTALHI